MACGSWSEKLIYLGTYWLYTFQYYFLVGRCIKRCVHPYPSVLIFLFKLCNNKYFSVFLRCLLPMLQLWNEMSTPVVMVKCLWGFTIGSGECTIKSNLKVFKAILVNIRPFLRNQPSLTNQNSRRRGFVGTGFRKGLQWMPRYNQCQYFLMTPELNLGYLS